MEGKNQPTITIDNITFTYLSSYIDPIGSRGVCQLTANDGSIKKLLTFYTSISEGGYWRFAIKESNSYLKGSDYVVTTFVHLQLQDFINKNFNFQKLEEPKRQDYYELKNDFNEIVDSPERKQDDPVFDVLNSCLSAYCFVKEDKFFEKTKFNVYNITDNLAKINNQYSLKFRELLEKSGLFQKIDELSKGSEGLNISQEVDEPECQMGIRADIIRKFFSAVSEYMELYFRILTPNPTFVTSFKKTFENNFGKIMLDTQIYELKIQNKENNYDYRLYYSTYQLTDEAKEARKNVFGFYEVYGKFEFNGKYRNIVIVVPSHAKINLFGVYDKVVYAGVYVYKIMEYISQCPLSRGRMISLLHYFFIGDLISDVWPLNKIN